MEGAVQVIYNTLAQVGLKHDEGPDVGGAFGPYIQSERKNLYRPYAEQLVREGKAYYCFCTKERLESLHNEKEGGGYDRHCRNLPEEEVKALLEKGTPYCDPPENAAGRLHYVPRCGIRGILPLKTRNWRIRSC